MLFLISIMSPRMRGVVVLFDVLGLFCVTTTVSALLAAMARINYFKFNGRRAHGMEGVELNFHVNMPPLLLDVNRTYDDAGTLAQIMHQTSLDVGFPHGGPGLGSLGGIFHDFGVGLGGLGGDGPGGVLPDFGVGFGGLGDCAVPPGYGCAAPGGGRCARACARGGRGYDH
ncbi:hypothetical protein Tco_1451896 [Tanacetum coccineum]